MPIHEYCCKECGQKFELLVPSERLANSQHCPHCASDRLERLFSTFATSGGTTKPASGCGCGNSKFS
jgi:putative FmdB family regulatory protein